MTINHAHPSASAQRSNIYVRLSTRFAIDEELSKTLWYAFNSIRMPVKSRDVWMLVNAHAVQVISTCRNISTSGHHFKCEVLYFPEFSFISFCFYFEANEMKR